MSDAGTGFTQDEVDEAIVSFEDVDDDDDDMLALFSFGADTSGAPQMSAATEESRPRNDGEVVVDYKEVMKSVMPLPVTNQDNDDGNNDDDSFIELLDQQQEATARDSSELQMLSSNRHADDKSRDEESNMQDILDWLDDDDEIAIARGAAAAAAAEEEELDFMPPSRPPPLAESVPKPKPPPPTQKQFQSLREAVLSHNSSLSQIRRLLEKENFRVDAAVRPHLWAKVICGKTLDEISSSSIADSFQHWEQNWQSQKALKDPTNEEQKGNSEDATVEEDKKGDEKKQGKAYTGESQRKQHQKLQHEWLESQSNTLADRIGKVLDVDLQSAQNDLFVVLANHYDTDRKDIADESGDPYADDGTWKDPLLPPVACVILSAGVPKVAAAVMTSQIIPSFMPILGLTAGERQKVGEILQKQFYLLACYHLPLLVWHLDKYMIDWYKWPPYGHLPQSWFVTHFAGEADGGPMMNPLWLLCLWDLVLTSSNNSLRFFLVLALLDIDAERLLLLTGDDLKDAFRRVVSFSTSFTNASPEGFPIEPDKEVTRDQASQWVHEWSDRALALWEETPLSVTKKLKVLEDDAISDALLQRQKVREERMRLKQEAEAKAQQEAFEAERERKADEARTRLTRARLVAFYRQFNPGKESNIDKIMSTYEGRYDVLDAKLKQKYGVGFNPALKPKPPPVNKGSNSNILASINVGFGGARITFAKRKDDQGQTVKRLHKLETRVVEVSASEVLPIICWSKEANQAKLSKLKKSSKVEIDANERMPLKFYLVDSRTETAALEQGRFPTSVSLSPEKLLDLDEVKLQEDMFESLRGSVHICVMGEGYAALPDLYGHKMTNGLAEFIREDDARINECALFFLSRGFPFVSVISGGFAAAHAFLCREGHNVHLRANDVLEDYNPEASLFGQFEKLHSSSGREKAQRSLQNLFDTSMTAITKNSMRLETLASELANGNAEDTGTQKGGQKNVVQRIFGGGGDEKLGNTVENNVESKEQTSHVPFRNPFARKAQSSSHNRGESLTKEDSSGSLVVESVEFDEDNPEQMPTDATNSSSHLRANDETTNLPKSQTSAANPFSGFGAALNNSLKANAATTAPSVASAGSAPRNPFAMFGNLGSTQNAKRGETKSAGMANHFAGFNQLRMHTMSRIRVPGKDGVEGSIGNVKPQQQAETNVIQGIVNETTGVTTTSTSLRIKEEESGDDDTISSVGPMEGVTSSSSNSGAS